MTTLAYSYVRFSTTEQFKGDSVRRQIQMSQEYASAHKLTLDQSLKMHDLGISAFDSTNSESGALSAFLKAVNNKTIPKGSYLLVESLDRISRNKVPVALELFLSILRSGITIVTLSDQIKYDYENLDTQQLIISISIMSRAHEESKLKSDRVSKAWGNKIKNADIKPVTKWVPAWLTIQNDRIVEVPERVAIVQDIYNWVCEGLGTTLIIKRLNEKGIKPWGSPINIDLNTDNKQKNRVPKRWYASYIQRLLTNKAVLGEYQPKRKSENHPAIKNYYPKIIDEGLFYKVQEIRKSRNVRSGNSIGRRGKFVTNMFSGLLRCGYSQENNIGNHKCAVNDSSVTIYSKGTKSKVKYLQCSNTREGGIGCDACRKLWRYDHFEHTFLEHVKEIDITTLFGNQKEGRQEINKKKNELSKLEGKKEELNKEINNVLSAFKNDIEPPTFIIERSHEIEDEQKIISAKIKEVTAQIKSLETNHSSRTRDYREFQNILAKLQEQDSKESLELRLKLSETLRQSIHKIDVFAKGRLPSKETRKILEKELPDQKNEIAETYKALENSKRDPILVIHYKTGARRIIYVDHDNPKNLLATFKYDENSNLVKEIRDTSKLFSQSR